MSKFSARWLGDRDFARVQILAKYKFDDDVLEAMRYATGVDA